MIKPCGCSDHVVILAEKGPKKPKVPKLPKSAIASGKLTDKVATRMEPVMETAFLQAMGRYQKQIDMAALRAAIESGSESNIEAALGKFSDPDGALEKAMGQTLAASGTAQAALLGEAGLGFSFNAVDPRAVEFAREQAGTLIVEIDEGILEGVREVLGTAQESGLTVTQQARAVRGAVGLPSTWANAPLSLAEEIRNGQEGAATSRRLSAVDKQKIRSRIRAGTVDEAFITEMQENYERSLLNRRALNIARTETMDSANFGQIESWRQGMEQGVIPSTARKVVIVTPDAALRPSHLAIARRYQDGIPINDLFETPWGFKLNPPWEPNCRCTIGIIFPALAQAA